MKRQSEIIDDLSPVKRALLAVEEMSARLEMAQRAHTEPIAICGIGCRFPGGANDPESYWQLLRDGKDAVTEVPPTRWDANTNGGNIRWGAFVDNVDQFDAVFFGISPREATHMDPQQRLVLEVAWEALADAGQAVERLAGTSTGVFLGIYNNDYAWLQSDAPEDIDVYAATGGGQGIAANRLSYLLDLRGPSIAIDTTCSSSLVAVHLACQSLRNGECGLALAGGVNLLLSPQIALSVSKVVPLAADGRCKTFDARADGIVRGEGCGIVVLKRLTDALADGDDIIAVIKGSATNQDGHSNGFTAPNGAAQQAVIRHALQNSGVTPADVSYVEAHGTGTQLGDPIEWESLDAVFHGQRTNPCFVGSVKTNFGHLEAAAGIAGLIKVALSLKHRAIPPHLHFTKMNPMTSSNGSLEVPLALRDWTNARALVAGVSSFSLGGTNAHVVLGEVPAADASAAEAYENEAPELCLVPLSARSDQALHAYAKELRAQLLASGDSERDVYDLARTASLRRSHLSHRLALVSRTQRELITLLGSFIDGETHPGLKSGRAPGKADGLVFVFSGQGTQWAGMGQKLMDHEPAFRSAVAECYELFSRFGVRSSLAALESDPDGSQPEIVQPAIFAIQVGLVALFREWGVVPDAVTGHSFGEIAAAYAAGILSLDEAARIVCTRAKLFERIAGLGGMAAVELPVREVEELLREFPRDISLAASNSPASTVLSGETAALQTIVDELKNRGVRCRLLRVNCAFHSQQVDAITGELEAALQDLKPQSASIPFFSTVTAAFVNGEELNASYWVRNARQTVWFAQAIETLSREHRVFLELAPHAALTPDIEATLKSTDDSARAIPTLRRDNDERSMLLRSLGTLYTSGRTIRWEHLYRRRARQVRLPSYPWQRKRYWIQSNGSNTSQATQLRPQSRALHPLHPLLGSRLQTPVCTFESQLTTESLAHLNHHLLDSHVIFPAAGYIEMALAAAREHFGAGAQVIRDLVFHGPLFLSSVPRTVQLTLAPENSERATVQIFSLSEDGAWTLHAAGTVSKPRTHANPENTSFDHLRAAFDDEQSIEEFGRRLATYGFATDGRINGLQRLWQKNGESLAQLRLAPELVDQLHSHCVHPFLLDTALQTLLAVLPEDGEDDGDDVFLSTRVARFTFHASPGVELWSHVSVLPYEASDRDHRTVNVRLYNSEGAVVAEVEGLSLRRVPLHAIRSESKQPSEYFYEIEWQAKQLRLAESANLSLNVAELAQRLAPWSTHAIEKFGLKHYRQVEPEVDALCSLYVVEALRELGLTLHESTIPEAQIDALGVLPRHRRLLNRMIEILCEDGILTRAGDGFEVGELPVGDAATKWQTLVSEHPVYNAELTLLGRCGESLAKILTGHSDSLELLFPGGSFEEAEHLYEASPFAQTFNSMVEQAIRLTLAQLKDGETLRVLEIGAGTGGTSAYVLPLLPSGQTRYVFTDVSNLFLYKARQKFEHYDYIDYKLLDIERDTEEQGFDAGQFDVVIASNVLHATSDLRAALNNVGRLMAPDALLLLLEATGKQRLVDFTFGLTDGWWEFKDNDLRPDYPLLPARRWLNLLGECEFVEARAIPENTGDEDLQTSLILAQSPSAKTPTTADCSGDWLICNDDSALGNELAATLKSRGGRVVEIFNNNFDRIADQSPEIRVIYLASLNETTDVGTAALDACANVLQLVQALGNQSNSEPANRRLWIVTRGAQPVAGDQSTLSTSPLWGLGPTIAMEHPEIWGGLIDLEAHATHEGCDRIIAEALANTGEDRVGFRGPQRYVARLRPATHKPAFGRVRFHGDASYLITGGCGGMGLRLAQWMADCGARNLVLAGRSGAASEEARLTVRNLEQAGVNVNVAQTDVSDADSVARLLKDITPPLRGVIHAAGIFDDRVLLRHDRERFARVMAPKVNGAWNLHLLTREIPLDFFVMFSSAAAFLGLMGLGNYTAANAFLDALAHYRHSLGLPALSIDWAGWTRIGMAEVLGERRESQWLAKGLDSLSPEQGLQAVNDLMWQSRPQVAVLKVDWPVFFKELPARRPPPLLADVARSAGPTTTTRVATGDFLSKLNAAEPGTPRGALLREHICQQVAKILEFDDSFVLDPHQPLAEVGLDSLMAIELRNMLSTSIDRQLPPTLLFDYPSIDSVYAYLATLVFAGESKPAIETAAEVDPELEGILEELESLPDNTVEMMLQGYARELLK